MKAWTKTATAPGVSLVVQAPPFWRGGRDYRMVGIAFGATAPGGSISWQLVGRTSGYLYSEGLVVPTFLYDGVTYVQGGGTPLDLDLYLQEPDYDTNSNADGVLVKVAAPGLSTVAILWEIPGVDNINPCQSD